MSSVPDPLAPFRGYVSARFVDDPHLWATALFDEVVALGYDRSYPSFARTAEVGSFVEFSGVIRPNPFTDSFLAVAADVGIH